MAFTFNQESRGHSGRALRQYSKHSSSLRSNIPQLLRYQCRNWYSHHNTTTKTPNLAREHINNDQQEREEDVGLPVAFKDDVRLAGEKGDKEELGNVPSSFSSFMIGGDTTNPIPYNADASMVKRELEVLSLIT